MRSRLFAATQSPIMRAYVQVGAGSLVKLKFAFAAVAALLLGFAPAFADQHQKGSPGLQQSTPAPWSLNSLTPGQKDAFGRLVREYLLKNPEVIVESIRRMRENDERAAREKARRNLVTLKPDLEKNAASPVGGNIGGNITIVEFFDYRCSYCKRVFPSVMKLLKDDGKIRYVFKEFPILGPESMTASRAALAVWNMDRSKYMAFHTAMMESRGGLTEKKVFRLAAGAGLNPEKLRAAMNDPAVDAEIQRNYKLAEALDITGTPAFVVGSHVVRGAIDMTSLMQLVTAARKG